MAWDFKEIKDFIKDLDISTNTSYQELEDMLDTDEFTCGLFKGCLLFPGQNFVIKFCRYGNSAEREAILYDLAKFQKLEMFFPKTELFFSYQGINYILQEKVPLTAAELPLINYSYFENIGKTVPDTVIDEIENILQERINSVWLKVLISEYGKKACYKLCDFLLENNINDLHGENLGFIKNCPKILDFSGC